MPVTTPQCGRDSQTQRNPLDSQTRLKIGLLVIPNALIREPWQSFLHQTLKAKLTSAPCNSVLKVERQLTIPIARLKDIEERISCLEDKRTEMESSGKESAKFKTLWPTIIQEIQDIMERPKI